MKKSLLFLASVLCSLLAIGADYGIMINGTDFHAGTANPTPGDPSFQEYMVLGVSVQSGATLQLYDNENKAGWAVDLDGASVAGITRDGDHYNCTETGCYDFYIKLKFNADQLYIGASNGCGNQGGNGGNGGNQGGNHGGTVEGNPRYYYKGFIDDADFEPQDISLFNQGVATISFSQAAYIFVLYQVDNFDGVQYMTESYVDGPTHATLYVDGKGKYEKWKVPVGTTKLYLYDNGDGSLEISSEPMSGKTLVNPAGKSAVENVSGNTDKTVKFIRNGQIFIRKGNAVYNALGVIVNE